MIGSLPISCPRLPRSQEMLCSAAEKNCEIQLRPNLGDRLTTRKCADLGLAAEKSTTGEEHYQYEIKPCITVQGGARNLG